MEVKPKKQRITSIDILRGMTIAGMILVNNPGGPEEETYAPLQHAEWLGLTPTDLIFPFFMFIMGITTYLSLKKFKFEWSTSCALKILKRASLLWLIGIGVSLLFMVCRGTEDPIGHVRILGVFPRLGICYGLAALIGIVMKHKFLPWLIAALFVGYWILLVTMNGYAHDETNIIAIVDHALFGANHVYRWESPDPEGLLSTIPALAHVLIGFCVGKIVMELDDINDKIERLFVIGAVLAIGGWLLSYGCPLSKKLWTPTFAMVTCGLGSVVLALLTWLVDKQGKQGRATRFFQVIGCNPLAIYLMSVLLLIPFGVYKLLGDMSIHTFIYKSLYCSVFGEQFASLLYAVTYVLINWAFGLYLFKKKIYIKL